MDSLKLDSLRILLMDMKSYKKVDALNQISELFASFYAVGGFTNKKDSMYYYAKEANKEAVKIDYKYGIAKSLLLLSDAFRHIPPQNRQSKDSVIAKEYLRQAIKIGEELRNDSILGSAYYLLASVEDRQASYMKAIAHFQRAGDLQQETEVTTWLCMLYSHEGKYEEGFPYCDKCIELAKKNVQTKKTDWAHELVQWSLYDMAELYKAAGDYETAMDYYKQFNQYAEENHLSWTISIDKSKAELFIQKSQFDSALYYWKKWEKNKGSNLDSPTPGQRASDNASLGLIYLKSGQPDMALPLFAESIKTFFEMGKKMSGYSMIKPLLYTSEVYILKNDFVKALSYTKEAYALSQEDNRRPSIMDSYELLSRIYDHLGKHDSAYFYLLNYTKLKDSIFNRQFLWRLNNYKKAAEDAKKEAQIGLLNKDNQIKQQQLKQEATFRNFLIAVFIAIIFAGLYVFRNLKLKRKNEKLKQEQQEQEWKMKHLESEKKQANLQRQAAELEMQALRAQMNPHFIFNCLSSINRFILKNESKAASNYLTRFSRLIRMVLINSQKPMISLEEELEMLRLYLDMERLRFKDSFDFVISFKNIIDTEAVLIPPLILQPICENALWHGLMHKESQGHLTIELSMEENGLQCVIADDGIGREKAAELKNKSAENEKSMGLQITAQRLALIGQNNNVQTFYEIEDITDENKNIAGTKVILKISSKEMKEEFV